MPKNLHFYHAPRWYRATQGIAEPKVTWPRACHLPPEQVTKPGLYLTHLRREANKLKINGRGNWNAEVILVFANNETGFSEQLFSPVPSTVAGGHFISHIISDLLKNFLREIWSHLTGKGPEVPERYLTQDLQLGNKRTIILLTPIWISSKHAFQSLK